MADRSLDLPEFLGCRAADTLEYGLVHLPCRTVRGIGWYLRIGVLQVSADAIDAVAQFIAQSDQPPTDRH
jgi:hypothetical protein